MITSTRARHVEQVALAAIDLFEIGIVRDILDALLRWDYLVVARHYRDRAKLKPFCQMHGSDRDLTGRELDLVAELLHRCGQMTGVFSDAVNGDVAAPLR